MLRRGGQGKESQPAHTDLLAHLAGWPPGHGHLGVLGLQAKSPHVMDRSVVGQESVTFVSLALNKSPWHVETQSATLATQALGVGGGWRAALAQGLSGLGLPSSASVAEVRRP